MRITADQFREVLSNLPNPNYYPYSQYRIAFHNPASMLKPFNPEHQILNKMHFEFIFQKVFLDDGKYHWEFEI